MNVAGAIPRALAALVQGTEESAELLKEVPNLSTLLLETLAALIVIVAVLLLVARIVRHRSEPASRTGAGPIELVATRALEPRRRLYLVRIGDEYCLVGSSEHGLHALSTITASNRGASSRYDPTTRTDSRSESKPPFD